PLASFFTLDALISRPVTRGLEVFLAGENLFNEAYEIGRTPVRSLGPPRTVRVGVRFKRAGLPHLAH
ncbi:MAG TPA: TonB-dependent receptor, partial [Thermoanaerobaculia bacterium]|nr:TonB-dependent receptor [Thermoanaerobaculia bacterium]